MAGVPPTPVPKSQPIRWAAWCAALSLAALLLVQQTAYVQPAPPEDGLFITVPNPITSEKVNRIKAKTERALQRTDRHIRKIVYDFNPGNQPSGTRDYGPCHDLADFILRELQNVTTVAFVHNDVSGHTVLPVLACKEIVMSSEARLGDVLGDQPKSMGRDQVQFYEEIANGRSRPPAIVLKMFDRDMEVLEGTRVGRGGVWYIDKRRREEETKQGVVVNRLDPVLVAGNPGFYGAADAQKYGLCDLIKETRPDMAEAYHLTASSLREDPLEGREPVAERLLVRERINKGLAETLKRRTRQAIARHANLLVLQLESNGGDTQVARDLAEFFRELKDDSGEVAIMTIAYIPERAPDAATILALGCTEIVMGKNAEIGDFDSIVYEARGQGRKPVDPERFKLLRDSVVGLAVEQGYPPLVVQGMLDPALKIYRVQSQKGQSESRFLSGEEWEADQAGPKKWANPTLIKPEGRFLKLDGRKAKEYGLAREVVDDLPDVYRVYGLEHVREAGFDFLYELAAFLRHPLVAVFLVMIGIACLILELKMPGVGLPGVIAALCFVLYFWSQSQQLSGQIIMLAILLFVLGLILIGLEIFLLPGFGVTGVSGIILVVVGLGLATLEKKPETTQEWLGFGRTIGMVAIGLAGAVTLAFVAAWYLPSIPYANRLVLKPRSEHEESLEGEEVGSGSEGILPETAALLGAIGVAATPLRPAGIARFGDDFVDVVSEGTYVAAGGRVQVIEIEGNRIVVKEV